MHFPFALVVWASQTQSKKLMRLCHSVTVTAPLTQVIQQQSPDIADVDFESMKNLTDGIRSAKNTDFIAEREEILALLNDEGKRYVELALEKGSSSWLSVVPTKQSGFC